MVIIPESFARVEPPLIYDINWTQSISPSMAPDKRENMPLIRVKKLICHYAFLSTECKILNYTKLILVGTICDEVARVNRRFSLASDEAMRTRSEYYCNMPFILKNYSKTNLKKSRSVQLNRY